MADYDIYVLEEDAVTISGGGQLDGQTQGDGSHLPGLTITLNAAAWAPVGIDDNDSSFSDNDSSQRLADPTPLNGITHADGRIVEAEYSFTVTDGTFNPDGTPVTWTLIAFNVREPGASNSYGTVEGIAFIGDPGGFPPVGTPLTILSAAEGPSFAVDDYATPICLAHGTRVAVPGGWRPVEAIAVGDQVITRDHGVRRVEWHGARAALAHGRFAPVQFAPGTLGNDAPLLLSQQHRVLLSGWRAELMFGTNDVMLPARHLVGRAGAALRPGGRVTYHHLLLDCHCAIRAEGTWVESLHLGEGALSSLPRAARREIAALFPELLGSTLSYPTLRRAEAALLRA